MKKLCVFPNDPLRAYVDKGEVKKNYFNPENFFDEIHVISFIDNDVNVKEVQSMAGTAKLIIYSVGKIHLNERKKFVNKILELIKKINPDVLRAYNPYVEGWFAAQCSQKLQIPLYLSLHTQYDHNRKIAKRSSLKKYLALKYTEKFIESFVLESADKISIVYKIIEPYVTKRVNKKPEILYNKVDFERFTNGISLKNLPKPLILTVGNLIKEKNHECLIKAMKRIDGYLLIIGNGELFEHLRKIIEKENLKDKIIIKKSVPNNEIQNYYKSADVYASAHDPEAEGLPMPVIEAMASGLPVIIPYQKEGYSDGLDDIAVFAERTPESFAKNITNLLKDPNQIESISKKSQNKAKEFDIKKIETQEVKIYQNLFVQ